MVSLHWHEILICIVAAYQVVAILLLTLPMPLLGGYIDYVIVFSLHVAALLQLRQCFLHFYVYD